MLMLQDIDSKPRGLCQRLQSVQKELDQPESDIAATLSPVGGSKFRFSSSWAILPVIMIEEITLRRTVRTNRQRVAELLSWAGNEDLR